MLLLLAATAGIVISLVLIGLFQPEPAATVSEVEREVRRIVLHRSNQPGIQPGGSIGPWWVSAVSVDEVTGEFRAFHLTSGSIRLAAKTARLKVDPEADAISFALYDVVYTKLPDDRDGDSLEHSLLHMDQYVLGPAPYRRTIVRDGQSTKQPSVIERLVGVSPAR